jgi:rhodanese-related sulfurtransferase
MIDAFDPLGSSVNAARRRSASAIQRALPRVVLTAAIGLALAWGVTALASDRVDTAHAIPNVPDSKRTSLGLYVTARQAYEKWREAPDEVKVIDVRTPEEFLFVGHPEMAWLVPFASQSYVWDAEKKRLPMEPLPDFVLRVRKVAEPDDVLLVTCRSGERGAMAVNALAKAGFTRVYNVTDGVEGELLDNPGSVFHGQRMVNGWKNSGLPWAYQIDPGRMVLTEAEETSAR